VKFHGEAFFYGAIFTLEVDFNRSTFSTRAYFSGEFNGLTYFNYTIFEEPSKVIFDLHDLSKVSFGKSDITKIIFNDRVTWGGKDRLTVV
jgi:hypothetical protein